eukprot:768691-Hanusia_phi.AAC.4
MGNRGCTDHSTGYPEGCTATAAGVSVTEGLVQPLFSLRPQMAAAARPGHDHRIPGEAEAEAEAVRAAVTASRRRRVDSGTNRAPRSLPESGGRRRGGSPITSS